MTNYRIENNLIQTVVFDGLPEIDELNEILEFYDLDIDCAYAEVYDDGDEDNYKVIIPLKGFWKYI